MVALAKFGSIWEGQNRVIHFLIFRTFDLRCVSVNQNLSNQHFEKFLGQRLRFRAIYDGVKINHKISPHKKYYKHGVIFKRVLEVSSGDEFRDHVHIQVKESVFNKNFKDLPVGEVEFEFTAELYEYLQPLREHQDGLQYKTWSIGLRDLKKLEKVKSKGEKDNADHLSKTK